MNFLESETSPYLLQHARNPIQWYPWCTEAFAIAAEEDKPVFLSIGYSTCHWCHVMAHESFENEEIAAALNNGFISVKVDKEERPDIDNVYMRICQAATGSGGWPMSIFMTPDQKPFFAGTYFPPKAFLQIITALKEKWRNQKESLIEAGMQLTAAEKQIFAVKGSADDNSEVADESSLMKNALSTFKNTFDEKYGGFGNAPKFPTPHNLMFLLGISPQMAEKTLMHMYKGGIFDHIGGGFSRYSTDERWLVPHFEKMLYDNALLAMTYTMAYESSGSEIYKAIAEKILRYLKTEMLSPEGGFYSAQDADIDGEEGKYYLFTEGEIYELLGEKSAAEFCARYSITKKGNYEGKNIPNLIQTGNNAEMLMKMLADKTGANLPQIYDYRKSRAVLHTDMKQLTGWNSLTVAAFAFAKRTFGIDEYLTEAAGTLTFIQKFLQKDGLLLAGFTAGKASGPVFLDDYAFYIFALIQMYKASGEGHYISEATRFTEKTIDDFFDDDNGGFFFSGRENERLITEVKETYDGAIPSGNAVMYYNLSRLTEILNSTGKTAAGSTLSSATDQIGKIPMTKFDDALKKHRSFMNRQAGDHPAGHCFYLLSLFPAKKIICEGDSCRPTDEIL